MNMRYYLYINYYAIFANRKMNKLLNGLNQNLNKMWNLFNTKAVHRTEETTTNGEEYSMTNLIFWMIFLLLHFWMILFINNKFYFEMGVIL